MTEYNIIGLQNYIHKFLKNINPKKDERGFEVLEKRYYENLNTDILTNEVHSKIIEKLADKISDKFIEDLLYEELLDKTAELKAQIEKMKCCSNCKHRTLYINGDKVMCYKDVVQCFEKPMQKCDNWEIAE